MWTCALVLLVGCGGPSGTPVEPSPVPVASPADDEATASAEPSEEADPPVLDATDESPSEPTAAPASSLRWELIARPMRLRMSQRARFVLRRQVTNTGTTAADAMTRSASFTVNGAPSMDLDMAFGNGARETLWAALPPGRTVFDEREMGESLFPAPGQYTLAMTVDGATSTVRVAVGP